MKSDSIFRNYEFLVDQADKAFHDLAKQYPQEVKCQLRCCDCCHAVFGLFLIEAAYIKGHFDRLEPHLIREALSRCTDAERALRRLEVKLQRYEDDPEAQAYIFASERIRCPLLSEQGQCIIYEHRPITCRVYGIPTRVQGKTRVCARSGFETGKSYRGFDLDGTYQQLFLLSREFLAERKGADPQKAGLLLSVPKVLTTPVEVIISDTFV